MRLFCCFGSAKSLVSVRVLESRMIRRSSTKFPVQSRKDPRSPSVVYIATASALFSVITATALLLPRHDNEALAADPNGSKRYGAVARGNTVDYSVANNLGGIQGDSFARAAALGDEDRGSAAPAPSRIYFSQDELSRMGKVRLATHPAGGLSLDSPPPLKTKLGDRFVDRTEGGNFVFYTIDPELQEYVTKIVNAANSSHTAVVAMNPRTGAVLAIAGKSRTISDIEYHAGFPAASLFKVVTAAAAVEQAGIQPDSSIPFRGGTYTLNESNYLPNARLDNKVMTVAEALGRSCNPVFGQLGVRYLSGPALSRYARLFGFNKELGFEVRLPTSAASIPTDDKYELSRTSAGFGEVRISPVHAATLMSGVANGGLLPRPRVVEKIVSPDGAILHRAQPESIHRIVSSSTASSLMEMMEHTTTVGTSRKEFLASSSRPRLGGIRVAAKTGTLTGDNPKGLNNWFIAAAPIENPQIALAVITVDAAYSSKASAIGRRVFERFFNVTPPHDPVFSSPRASSPRSKGKVSYKGRSTARTSYSKKVGKSKVVAAKAKPKSKK